MNCVICKTGETEAGIATVTLTRGETVVMVKGTPAEICRNCGEYYLDEAVAGWVYATGPVGSRPARGGRDSALRRVRARSAA